MVLLDTPNDKSHNFRKGKRFSFFLSSFGFKKLYVTVKFLFQINRKNSNSDDA